MTEAEKAAFRQIHRRAAGAVAFVAVQTAEGSDAIGSAFHIGNGVFVTARHVVEGCDILEIATTKSAHLEEEAGGKVMPPRPLILVDGPHFGSDDLDVAVFKVDLGAEPLPAITLSQHTDYALGEDALALADVLIVGYPPIPFTTEAVQVAALGQINAVVRVRHSSVLHFIGSATARGGFSGGPVLDEEGVAIALVTEALGHQGTPTETGFMSLLSIEPALDLAAKVYGFGVEGWGGPGRYSEVLLAARFSNPASRSLNSLIYVANLYVYDDDRDLVVEIDCSDPAVEAAAVAAFDAITSIKRMDVIDGSVLYLPQDNPPAQTLLDAGEAVIAIFEAAGFRRMATERSEWQLRK